MPRPWPEAREAAVLVLAVSLLIPAVGRAASYESDVDVIVAKASQLSERVDEMEAETQPGAFLTNTEAITRFQDYLYLHLVGENGAAAEGFFSLVTTGALSDSGLHRDAEWYLAESLVGLENYKTAAQRFLVIVEDDTHPFRDDGVRRLLELYAAAGDRASFRELYDREIVPGRVKPTGLITYSLAKSFYQQDDFDNARGYFHEVAEGNSWYSRARYFLGTIAVREGDLQTAIGYFEESAECSIESADDRKVHDLALLALGRIHYHIQDYFQASEYYNRIGGDSAYQADKLYEIIWTSIRRERWRDALNNVEIFLLAFPEHEYAAQLKLLQGHLNFQEENWTDALESYEQVVMDYTPVHERFSGLALPGSAAEAEAREIIEDIEGAAGLPPYAVAMMRNDPELGRAMDVFQELELERRDIEASERLIADLRGFLASSGSLGSYESMRLEALEHRVDAMRQRLALLAAEGAWLAALSGAEALPAELAELERRRQALLDRFSAPEGEVIAARALLDSYERRVGQLRADADNIRREADATEASVYDLRTRLSMPGPMEPAEREAAVAQVEAMEAELDVSRTRLQGIDEQLAGIEIPHILDTVEPNATDALNEEISALARAYLAARPSGASAIADHIDESHRLFVESYERLAGIILSIARVERSEIGRIQRQFEREIDEVGRQRTDHDLTVAAAREVSLGLTRDGFGRLEDFFAGSVLKADMGIVDVYWAQKLEVADELERVKSEKEDLLADLDHRFRLIREKMGGAQ